MTGIGGCRSSGVLGASAIVSSENAKLISVHMAITVNGGACTVKVFNGTDNSGTEIVRFHNEVNGFYNVEYDMHGVMCREGIFLEITEVSSSTANVSVEFN